MKNRSLIFPNGVVKAIIVVTAALILTACTPAAVEPAETALPQPSATATMPPTPEPTPTNSPIPELYTISFQSFHDYNGNGVMEEREPVLEGILNQTSAGECTTNVEGKCDIVGVLAGNYHVTITDNREAETLQKMKFILPSVSENRILQKGLDVTVEKNEIIALPLGQGTCVFPFPFGWNYDIGTYFDDDKRVGFVANWKGESDIPSVYGSYLFSYKIRVEDGHYAIDFIFSEETPILASDAGYISVIRQDTSQTNENDYFINIETDSGLHLDYGHVTPLSTIKVGQSVYRGQPIGFSTQHYSYPQFGEVFMVHVGFFPSHSAVGIDPYESLWIALRSDLSQITLDN